MSKVKKYFGISTALMLITIFMHLWLMSLTSYDSVAWLNAKDPASVLAIILSVAGITTSIITMRLPAARVRKYLCGVYVFIFLLLIIVSLLLIAISNVGFLG